MSILKEGLQARIDAVRERMTTAAERVGRSPTEVRLLAVSKTFPASAVEAAIEAGLSAFGENYAQEGCDKVDALRASHPDAHLEWHFIGPLQSNKTRGVAERFDWVQSVDRERIALRLAEQRPADLPPLNVLLQVNISDEDSKSGVVPSEVSKLAAVVATQPRLRLRGLMAIPEPATDPEQQREPLARMRALFERLRAEGYDIDTLSMGMSTDLDAAIAEGATLVRVGTAIFGGRS
ncbi:MAG: YggS family pyridoxal phosphate-dependent enzyme [Burkholderiaceae bacterium]